MVIDIELEIDTISTLGTEVGVVKDYKYLSIYLNNMGCDTDAVYKNGSSRLVDLIPFFPPSFVVKILWRQNRVAVCSIAYTCLFSLA